MRTHNACEQLKLHPPGYDPLKEWQAGGHPLSWKMERGHYCDEHMRLFPDDVCDYFEKCVKKTKKKKI